VAALKPNPPRSRVELGAWRTLEWLGARAAGRNCVCIIPLACLLLALPGCAADSVSDRREGQLIVCHKGNKTLAVSNADSFLHLDHGDTLGPCPEEK
jgi:hypothetical protein